MDISGNLSNSFAHNLSLIDESWDEEDESSFITFDLNPVAKPHTGIESKRSAVLSGLSEIHQHLTTLKQQNRSTNELEALYDDHLLNTIIKAENLRHPHAPLIYLEDGLAKIAELDFDLTPLALINLENIDHTVVADLRRVDGQKSVIIFDALHHQSDFVQYADDDLSSIPGDIKVSVFCLDQQKSSYGCKIFSLSIASKLADIPDFMHLLHRAHVQQDAMALAKCAGANKVHTTDNIDVYDFPSTVPPILLKHTQSRSSLTRASVEQLSQAINKQGQTLQQRQQHKLVRRTEIRAVKTARAMTHSITFSASIEDKRIVYVERARQYMQTAPASEVERLADQLSRLRICGLMPAEKGI